MPEPRRESPLVAVARLPYQGREFSLVETAFAGHVNLRGDGGNPRLGEAVRQVLGLELPLAPNTVSAVRPPAACWLGPDEWLLRLPAEADAGEAVRGLESALAGELFAASDISSAQTVIALGGPRAREVLQKGCTLDLHPRAFAPGQCAQTQVAKAAVLLAPVEDEAIDLVVRRSFADYLARWLLDAGR